MSSSKVRELDSHFNWVIFFVSIAGIDRVLHKKSTTPRFSQVTTSWSISDPCHRGQVRSWFGSIGVLERSLWRSWPFCGSFAASVLVFCRSITAVMKYPTERRENKFSAKEMKERLGAVVMSWHKSWVNQPGRLRWTEICWWKMLASFWSEKWRHVFP